MNYVKIDDLKTHPDLQVRVRMNEEMIEDLAEIYRQDMDDVEPVDVFQLDDDVYLIDGHHRFEAAKRAGLDKIPVWIVEPESFTEAIQMAMVANSTNPTPLSRQDIRRAVEILLKYDPSRSIENICAILSRSKSTIYQYVRELSDAGKLELPKTRKGKDGKERPTKYADREPKESLESSETAERDDSGCFKETAHCGNPGCQRMCSTVYLEELQKTPEEWEPGDWVFGNLDPEKAYCSEECREYAEGKVLEKEADRILKTAESAELAENSEPEEVEDPMEDEKSSADVAPCPICGKKPNVCLDGSITCWGDHKSTGPDHELAIRVGKKRTREQVRELWNRLAVSR